jgi:hypothetical protein
MSEMLLKQVRMPLNMKWKIGEVASKLGCSDNKAINILMQIGLNEIYTGGTEVHGTKSFKRHSNIYISEHLYPYGLLVINDDLPMVSGLNLVFEDSIMTIEEVEELAIKRYLEAKKNKEDN